MKTKSVLKILAEEIHSVVIATVDKNGLPATRVIDIMLHDDESVYFITAKGKMFYTQLMEKGYISLSGITFGKDSMSKKSISISGAVKNINTEKLKDIFAKNQYMESIYPTPESKTALKVFKLYRGQGEFFDLTTKPITRKSFTLGGQQIHSNGYHINKWCTRCGLCQEKCPSNCIQARELYTIIQENCLHCGICLEVCPEEAVLKMTDQIY